MLLFFPPPYTGNYVPTEQKNEEDVLGKKADGGNDTYTERRIWNTDIDPVLQSGFLSCFTSVNQLKLRSTNRLHFPPVNTGF